MALSEKALADADAAGARAAEGEASLQRAEARIRQRLDEAVENQVLQPIRGWPRRGIDLYTVVVLFALL